MGTNITTITLAEDFDYDSIIFKWDKHVMNPFHFFSERLNTKYGTIVLKEDEMWNLLFHPSTDHKELKDNEVDLIRKWYLDQVYKLAVAAITTNNKTDIKTKMDLVPLMAFNARNSNKVGVRTSAHLAKMFNVYTTMKTNNTEPEIFQDEDACVLFILGFFFNIP